EYYRGRVLERLPFVPPADLPLAAFEAAAEAAPGLRETFLSALFWIHVDHRRFAEAQAIAGGFLARHPGNRLVRQMRGDALFHEGRLKEARDEYQKLREEYALLARAPGR